MQKPEVFVVSWDEMDDFVRNEAKPGDIVVSVPDALGRRLLYACQENNKSPNYKYLIIDEEYFQQLVARFFPIYNLAVGELVVTSTGKYGLISSICECELCRERGFFEPTVHFTDGSDELVITSHDKETGFKNFYQIGKYTFGNIDKKTVQEQIASAAAQCEALSLEISRCTAQLKTLERLEKKHETE